MEAAPLENRLTVGKGIAALISEAFDSGCLSIGTLDQFVKASGIPLACTTQPVVVLTPEPPARNLKYHLRSAPPTRSARLGMPQFEGGEHTAIGDSATLYFSAGDPGTPAYQVQLGLPNGLSLTYGQIVALGGDFYGIPDAPISDGADQAARVVAFGNAFATLSTAAPALAEAPQILAVMQTEITAVQAAIDAGQSASSAYDALGDTLSEQWNRITGGGSPISPWLPMGRYLELAAVNWDHFGEHAVLAYQAGHEAALAQALVARASQQRSDLVLAYAMNAFADHFLSDLFSGGHIRTPRKELYNTVTPSASGSLLSRFMHDEDCHWGLSVTSATGNLWRAYGDKRYFDTVDIANKILVDIAVQTSVDEVFDAFLTGAAPQPSGYDALAHIPDLLNASNQATAQASGNVSPLFYWDGNVVHRRNDVNDLNDYSWTTSWWGWSTLALLEKSYAPAPPQGYPVAPTFSAAVSQGGWQSGQSVPPNWVAGAQVRYAFSYVGPSYESVIGPWSAAATVGASQAFPTLTGIAAGPGGTTARRLFRQFGNQPPVYVGQIADNTTTTFVDTTP